MQDIYETLLDGVGELKQADEDVSGIDSFLSGGPVKVASLDDLFKFARISDNTLVHKAEKDLWRIGEDDKGQVVIERLFDPASNEPLRI